MIDNHLIDNLAAPRHGLVTRRELLACGATPHEINRMLNTGQLVTLLRGVFRLAGAPPGYRQDLAAACLVNGRQSVVSHRAAAHLWGLELPGPPVLELSVMRSGSARTPDVVVHRPWRIDERHLTEHEGFRLTIPARTLADLGAVVDRRTLAAVTEQALVRRMASVPFLRHLCDRLDNPKRPGPRMLLAVLADRALADRPPDSLIETELAGLCRRHGIPAPEFQYEVVVDGRHRFIDFAYPDLRIAIEIDGWAEHMQLRKFADDRVRRNALELLGWRVLSFTWHQITDDPDYVIRTIIAALDRRVQIAG